MAAPLPAPPTGPGKPPAVHGLAYDRAFLDTLPVLAQRPAPHEPIRALSAQQFGELHLQHLLAHPPDSVLFPFLHGLEGDNQAQNLFFASTSADEHGHLRVPNFRGLVWVAADEPDPAPAPRLVQGHPAGWDSDDAGSSASASSSDIDIEEDHFGPADAMQDAFGMPMDVDADAEALRPQDPNAAPHMHPVAHRGAPLTPAASTATVTATTVNAIGRTSSSTSTDILDYAYPSVFPPAHDRRPSDASMTSSFVSDASSLFDTRARSMTTSTILSSPTSSPPSSPTAGAKALDAKSAASPAPSSRVPRARSLPLFTSTFRPGELLKSGPNGLEPVFVPPQVPDGISLRNFGIQVPVYATLSDVVVYSPRGDARAALELAEKFKAAIETKAAERQRRHECGLTVDSVKYNVFVLCAAADEIEEHIPHLLKRHVGHPETVGAVPAGTCALPPSLGRAHASSSSLPDAMPGVEGLDDVAETKVPQTNGTLGLTVNTNVSAGAAPRTRRPLLRANTVDFAQREKDEMRELTRASEIFSALPADAPPSKAAEVAASTTMTHWDPAIGQIFLGNLNDVPAYDAPPGGAPTPSALEWHVRPGARATPLPREPDEFDHGLNDPALGLGFDVCIECHDMAPFPSSAHVRAAEEHLRLLDKLWAEKCAARGGPRRVRPPPNAAAVIHLPFPSSPPNTTVTVSALMPFIAFLERQLAPVSAEPPAEGAPGTSSPGPDRHRTRPLKVLIYSSDGYTESSVLALCLLMALRGLTLPESYLELQVEKRRSFFVYASDLGVLKRVETRVNKERGRLAVRRGSIGQRDWAGAPAPATPPPPATPGSGRSSPRTIGRPPSSSVSYGAGGSYGGPATAGAVLEAGAFQPQTLPVRRPRSSTTPLPSLFADHQAWFSDPRFDGSFPSRVLPFLYLGNLNHASNAYMLHALGITHVLSVGECALVPPPNYGGSGPQYIAGRGPGCHGSLWIEEREGRIKVLDIKGVCDDGIDSLEPQFEPVCAWIDRARAEGGNVLVHCRVGVSRSATITIAYVMQHLRVSLVDAYLIVRSRRLSVLIQPNMRLLYSLLGWEIKLARERAGGDPDALKAELARSLNWPYLAKEVHALNEKYLK